MQRASRAWILWPAVGEPALAGGNPEAPMRERKGEKVGWIGGWLGGFVWVLILSVVFLVQRRALEALVGLVLVGVAVGSVLLLSPWRHPDTPYWKLLVSIYALFLASIGWAAWAMTDLHALGLSAWSLFLLLPLLSPFVTVGQKRWRDGEARRDGETQPPGEE
jgi:hypothetical protein